MLTHQFLRGARARAAAGAARAAGCARRGYASTADGDASFCLELSDDQKAFRELARKFAAEEIIPKAAEYDVSMAFPQPIFEQAWELGLVNTHIPEEYGGSYSDVVTYGIICEEIARVDWVVASVISVSNSLCAGSISRFGNDAQKDRWLPGIAKGEVICSASPFAPPLDKYQRAVSMIRQ